MDKLPKIERCEGGWCRTGIFCVEVIEGYEPPFWYGLAWWSFQTRRAVCYPIPLNWIMWLLRTVYWKLKFTPRIQDNPIWRDGYNSGYSHGVSIGISIGNNPEIDQKKFKIMWELHQATSKSST